MSPDLALRGPHPTPLDLGYRLPAEWEAQESVWLVWPRDPKTWPGRVDEARGTFLKAMQAVTPHQRVDLVVHPELLADAKSQVAAAGIQNVSFHPAVHQDSWIRDYGALYLTKGPAESRTRLAVRFQFNAWGGKYETLLKDARVVETLAAAGTLGAPLMEVDMVLEGGAIDGDGMGTLLTTEASLLAENRNPDMTREDIEGHLRQYLGATKVLWLGQGIEGDDTDGHVDDVARFVAPTMVAACVEEDRNHPNHQVLDDNLDRLKRMTDARRRPVNVIEIPMPKDQETEEGAKLPASHANFLITNGAVLMPTFGGPSDEVARRRLQQAFKDRPVVPLACTDLIWGMGAIHCLSQQMPRGVPAILAPAVLPRKRSAKKEVEIRA
ncbi:MAG: agmatine deiminase family protein [Thermoplasmatota archaeon]